MAKKPLISVVGATGAQGGGLVRAILSDPEQRFAARAVTRNPESDAAKALAKLGAEVVTADVDDLSSLEHAFAGADGAFCVTNYWAHHSPEREMAQALNLARAAKAARVGHVIWSTLEDTRKFVPLTDERMPTLMGKYKVPHFDAKGESNQYFAALPTTYLGTTFYWENLLSHLAPRRGPDSVLTLTLPMGDAPIVGIAAGDIGHCAFGIFRQGAAFVGKTVGIAGDKKTGKETAEALTRTLGEKVVYQDIPPEVYRGFGFPGADDLGNMFQFYRDFAKEFGDARDLAATRALYPGLLSFDAWLARYGKQIQTG